MMTVPVSCPQSGRGAALMSCREGKNAVLQEREREMPYPLSLSLEPQPRTHTQALTEIPRSYGPRKGRLKAPSALSPSLLKSLLPFLHGNR